MKKRTLTTSIAFMAIGIVAAMELIANNEGFSTGISLTQEQRDWPVYGGGPENNHYSNLTQINRQNVKRLAAARRFDTEEEGGRPTNPITVARGVSGSIP